MVIGHMRVTFVEMTYPVLKFVVKIAVADVQPLQDAHTIHGPLTMVALVG